MGIPCEAASVFVSDGMDCEDTQWYIWFVLFGTRHALVVFVCCEIRRYLVSFLILSLSFSWSLYSNIKYRL